MFRAHPAARASRDDQPSKPTGKAYPFLRMPMMARIRRPLAYPFLRPRTQKRVRMHTIVDGRPRICPPFPAAIPAAYPFLRSQRSGKQQSVPISAAQHAEMGTLQHAAGSAETGTVSPAPTSPPSQKWVRQKQASVRQAFGKQAFFPAESGTALGPAAPRHSTPPPQSGAFSDESCDAARPLPPRCRTNNLHDRSAESGTPQNSQK
ncbi:hypothetical protein LMG9673_03937 [Ralstonia pseudosolanacearum]|nr:hypothetical protein LMG9673_03937 [Ralstonia pseudosolanacearum]